MSDFVIENWCLWDWVQITDYLLEGFEDALPKLVKQDDIIFAYNQYNQAWSKKSCTIFSAIGAISDLYNYEFSLDEIKKIDDMSYTRWRVKDSGRRVQAAVKLVADRWNDKHKDKGEVAYYLVDTWNNDKINEILDKWYTLMTSFQGNFAFIKDYQADLVLNGTKFGTSTFGHAINVRKINWKRCCKDSAKWTDHNVYELEHTLEEIVPFSTNAYIYTKVLEDKLEDVKRLNEFKTNLQLAIETNSKMWHQTNSENYRVALHDMNKKNRDKLKDIEEQLKRYM